MLCMLVSEARPTFPNHGRINGRTLEVIHMDIHGSIELPNINGNRYYVSFIDNFSPKTWIYFLKNKEEALAEFKESKPNGQKPKRSGRIVTVNILHMHLNST